MDEVFDLQSSVPATTTSSFPGVKACNDVRLPSAKLSKQDTRYILHRYVTANHPSESLQRMMRNLLSSLVVEPLASHGIMSGRGVKSTPIRVVVGLCLTGCCRPINLLSDLVPIALLSTDHVPFLRSSNNGVTLTDCVPAGDQRDDYEKRMGVIPPGIKSRRNTIRVDLTTSRSDRDSHEAIASSDYVLPDCRTSKPKIKFSIVKQTLAIPSIHHTGYLA
jgi:hypothetical protein